MKIAVINFALSLVIATFLVLQTNGAPNEPEIISLGPGHSLQWSPSGIVLSFVSDGRLVAYEVNRAERLDLGPFTGTEYAWVTDSQVVNMTSTWNEEQQARLVTLSYLTVSVDTNLRLDSMTTRMAKMLFPPKLLATPDAVFLLGVDSSKPVDPIANRSYVPANSTAGANPSPYLRAVSHFPVLWKGGKNVMGDTDVWLVDRTGRLSKRVTFDKEYSFAELSPTGEFIFCTDVAGYLRIIDTSGNDIAKVYGADRETWMPDGTGVVFAKLQYEGEDLAQLVGGDLYLFTITPESLVQLTFSPDEVEARPCVSPRGDKLAYVAHTRSELLGIKLLTIGGRP